LGLIVEPGKRFALGREKVEIVTVEKPSAGRYETAVVWTFRRSGRGKGVEG